MLKNYFKIAYRNLLKNKVFSIVNIFGLAIGMSACFFIFLFVHFETNYDGFHKNAANLYRVPMTLAGSFANNSTQATNHPGAGPALKVNFPEVVDYARVAPLSVFSNASMISYTRGTQVITFNEDKFYLTDPSFLNLFSFPFVAGDAQTALSDGKSIVISSTIAKKYFGEEDPIGKTLSLNREMPFKVTGVFKDVPQNSHIKFDILASFKMLDFTVFKTMANRPNWLDNVWNWPEFYTYALLAPGTDPKKLESKFPAFVDRYMGEEMKKLNFTCRFHLQPITDIHLRSNYNKEVEANGSEKEVYFLSVIGVFILVIAWINYINLSTAKSVERAKEVGLRKVVGAARIQLISQFIMESVMINAVALCIAGFIVFSCYSYFGAFTGRDINEGFSADGLMHQPLFWVGLFGTFTIGAFLVGAYPAFVLSAFKPVLVMRGRFFQSTKGIVLRKTLVSFQFILSILLIAGTITVHSQLSYMRRQSLGYNKEQVVVLKAPAVRDSTISNKMAAFQNSLLANPAVLNVSASTEIPGKTIVEKNTVRKDNEDETHNFTPFLVGIDDRFINTYQVQMAAGRTFLPGESSPITSKETARVIVNEELVKGLGYKNNEEAVGRQIVFKYFMDNVSAEIIGVIKNYHQRSLRETYDPILYYYPKDNSRWAYLSVRLNSRHLSQDIASLENAYKDIFPGNAFEYFFLDDYFGRQYQADQQFGNVFSVFTVLAIFVACLGLLGLSSFVMKSKTREIGIRKVLGASVYSLLVLFSKDFMKLVCLAALVALPIVYFTADRWLDNYAFHIRLGWMIFILPPLLILVISLFTISLYSVRAALANPVDNLKTE